MEGRKVGAEEHALNTEQTEVSDVASDATEPTKNLTGVRSTSTADGEGLGGQLRASSMTKHAKTVIEEDNKCEGEKARGKSDGRDSSINEQGKPRAGTVLETDTLKEIVWVEPGLEEID